MKSILLNAEQHIKKDKLSAKSSNTDHTLSGMKIVVIGCGGAGNNTINRLEKIGGINGAKTVAINTDRQHLESTKANCHILIGHKVTKGIGTRGDLVLGHQAGAP